MSRHLLRGAAPLAVAALALAASSPAAAQAPVTTAAALKLSGPAAKALEAAGATLTAEGPGAETGAAATLLANPLVRDAGDAYVGLTGELAISAGRRSVRLSGIEVQLTGFPSISARAGDRRLAVFALDRRSGTWSLSAAGADVRGVQVRLTAAGARVLRQRLGRKAIAAGRVGTLRLRALAAPKPVPVAPLPADAPAGARVITGGTVSYAPRASWVNYLRQAEGASAEDGATFDGTTYTLPIAGGWYDGATGTATVRTTGTTAFRYSRRGIDIALGAWTYDVRGGSGMATAVVERAQHIAESPDPSAVGQRAGLFALDPARLVPAVGADGATLSWAAVPMTLADSGTPIFNAYPPGSEQGSVTISATLAPAG